MVELAPHTEKPEECDNCQWLTDDLKEYDAYARTQGHGPFTLDEDKDWGWLCIVCCSTWAGRAYQFPRQYEDADVMAVIAWGINYLASILRERG